MNQKYTQKLTKFLIRPAFVKYCLHRLVPNKCRLAYIQSTPDEHNINNVPLHLTQVTQQHLHLTK